MICLSGSFSASNAFEQSYGRIYGDSASLAEYCAMISALTDIPIKQSFAVTGSINQQGMVQAVGGVNEKIEGFFEICKLRGLDGSHGCIIPAVNVKNLVLRDGVVNAIKAKQFSIYAVEHVDQALEVLTGKTVGTVDEKGTINYLVKQNLLELADQSLRYRQGTKQKSGIEEKPV